MRMLTAAGILAVAYVVPALAQPEAQPQPTRPPQICIHPFDTPTGSIDHTKVVDAQTILFYMRDGKIWKNMLHAPCRGLLYHGFSFVTHQDLVCANAQAIQVIQTGQVCVLGDFVAYTPPPDTPPPAPH
jgi:hypothetical protein